MGDVKTLYDRDFCLWSKEQAEALRDFARGVTNQPIDWENVAEEIESLGVSQKIALRSQLRRVIQHLLKLEFSPAMQPRRGWFESVSDARSEIEDLIELSPSLRREVDGAIAMATRQGVRKAVFDLQRYGELDSPILAGLRARVYTEEQILGDWFPPEPEDMARQAD